jgi:Ca2+-binding RTX toxin-like protein
MYVNVENLVLIGTAALDGAGNALNNTLTGNSASNVLDGGAGADSMTGGAGDDTYVVDNAGDSVVENANEGTDTVRSSVSITFADNMYANVENLVLTGTAAINGTGNALNNILTGNSGSNVLDGDGGTDTVIFAGPRSSYTLTSISTGMIVAGPDGTDTLRNVEFMTFSDGTIAVPAYEPPADVLISNAAVAENSAIGTLVGVLSALDATPNDSFTYELIDSAGGRFAVNGANLVVNGPLDYETAAVHDLTVRVHDALNSTLDRHLKIHVTDVAYQIDGDGANNVLTGTAENETINGFAGNDTISGGWAADTLNGGLGDDTLDGGPGFDTAVFAGLRASYQITPVGNAVQVSGPDGADSLTLIEKLHFNDLDLLELLVSISGDFNGDGTSDMLWRHNDGTTYAWLMDAGQRNVDVDLELIPNQWHIEETGDFNGDGTSDILWRNDDGTAYSWLMQNGQRTIDVDYGIVPTQWHIQATGDFDGDGATDILWRDDQGRVIEWLMDNGQRGVDVDLDVISTQWHIQGTGDFNGDGRSDILWRNDDGSTLAWLMQDGQRVADMDYGVISNQWRVQGVGDFNGDGTSDIIWRHDDGTALSWVLHNGTRNPNDDISYGVIPNQWDIQGTGDVDGDGTTDVIWRHDDGTTYAWLMDNGQRGADENLGAIPNAWTIQRHMFDLG